MSSGPVNFQDEDGNWIPISNDLVEVPGATYAVENEANSYTVSIPENPAATPVKFETDGAWVTMKLMGSDDVDPSVEGSEAAFENLVPHADVVAFEATDTGVKETITLNEEPSSPVAYSYALRVSAGITPVLTEAGRVEFRDPAGEIQFVIPVGFMTDSARTVPATSTDVQYRLRANGSTWKFTVIPSWSWLTDPARVYPVVVDPTVDKMTQKDCWLEEESPNAGHCGEYVVKAGLNNNLKKRRGLFDFNINQIPAGAVLNNATAWMWVDSNSSGGSGGGTSFALFNPTYDWSGGATWAHAVGGVAQNGLVVPWNGGGNSGQISTSSVLSGATSGWAAFEMTARVQGWINGSLPNRGVLLRQVNENSRRVIGVISSDYPTAGFRPLLRVDWTDRAPTVGTPTISPTTSSSATSQTPAFSAVVTDPERTSVAACFWVWTVDWATQVWQGCGPWVPSGQVSSATIPADKLVIGQAYNVQAIGADGVNWSSNWTYQSFFVQPSALSPLIARGRAIDNVTGQPIANAQVVVGVEEQVAGQGGTPESNVNAISTAVTDAEGRFAVYGHLSAPATVQADGSVRLELSVIGSNRARIHYINAQPPLAGEDWKWSSEAAEPAVTEGYANRNVIADDLAGDPVEDLVIDFSSPTQQNATSGSPVAPAEQYPDAHRDSASLWTGGTMPMLDPEKASVEEYDDALADWTAVNANTMAQEEADYAAKLDSCNILINRVIWRNTASTTDKELPVHAAYLLGNSMVSYSWSTTERTQATISMTGSGKNYSGGLAFSKQQDSSTGIQGTKTAANTEYQWVATWTYRKQKQICRKRNGEEYATGAYRWIPEEWRGDMVAKTGTVSRWACNTDYRIALTENYWVSRSSTETWNGWFQIAGLPGVSRQRSAEEDVRTDYLYRTEGVEYRLCGKGALPKDAAFVEETYL